MLTPQEWANLPITGGEFSAFGSFGQKQYYRDSETDLFLLGMGSGGRYYDPAAARFISEDPLRHAAGDDNLFRYVANDPVNRIDPSGARRLRSG